MSSIKFEAHYGSVRATWNNFSTYEQLQFTKEEAKEIRNGLNEAIAELEDQS